MTECSVMIGLFFFFVFQVNIVSAYIGNDGPFHAIHIGNASLSLITYICFQTNSHIIGVYAVSQWFTIGVSETTNKATNQGSIYFSVVYIPTDRDSHVL